MIRDFGAHRGTSRCCGWRGLGGSKVQRAKHGIREYGGGRNTEYGIRVGGRSRSRVLRPTPVHAGHPLDPRSCPAC
eukprot:2254372-Prymnesium_polylepis.1